MYAPPSEDTDTDADFEAEAPLQAPEPNLVFHVRGKTFACQRSVVHESAFFSLILDLSGGPFVVDRDPDLFEKMLAFATTPSQGYRLLLDVPGRDKLIDELDFYAVTSAADIHVHLQICGEFTVRDAFIAEVESKKGALKDLRGFLTVFKGLLKRKELDPCHLKLLLRLLNNQAGMMMKRWEIDDERKKGGFSEVWPQVVSGQNCWAWFKDPDFVNQKVTWKFNRSPLWPAVYQIKTQPWLELDIAKMLIEEEALISKVRAHPGLEDALTGGIDDLFSGTCELPVSATADVPNLLLLMHRVLFHVTDLLGTLIAKQGDREEVGNDDNGMSALVQEIHAHLKNPYSTIIDRFGGFAIDGHFAIDGEMEIPEDSATDGSDGEWVP